LFMSLKKWTGKLRQWITGRHKKNRVPVSRRRTRLALEMLEDRLNPSPVSWTGNAGTLNWSDLNNWSNNAVPTSVDDVTISKTGVGTISISGAAYAVRSLNDTTAGLSIASGASKATCTANRSRWTSSGGCATRVPSRGRTIWSGNCVRISHRHGRRSQFRRIIVRYGCCIS
jgi:hypothetical protein